MPPDAADDQAVAVDAEDGPTDTATAQDTATDSGVETAATGASCQGKCGAAYAPAQPCQCTFECAKYKNCCADFAAACPNGPSCANRCDQPFNPTAGCQCGWDCAKDGLCCADWLAGCHSTDQLDYATAPAGTCNQPGDWLPVKSVPDGDTVHLQKLDADGVNVAVRFLLVDTPETAKPEVAAECGADDAKAFTKSAILASAASVCLLAEPSGEDKDVYGRLLRYVYINDPKQQNPIQLNLRLLRLGHGRVLYPFAKGNPQEALALMTMQKARDQSLGGWSNCGWTKVK